jgi:hypothetical protein
MRHRVTASATEPCVTEPRIAEPGVDLTRLNPRRLRRRERRRASANAEAATPVSTTAVVGPSFRPPSSAAGSTRSAPTGHRTRPWSGPDSRHWSGTDSRHQVGVAPYRVPARRAASMAAAYTPAAAAIESRSSFVPWLSFHRGAVASTSLTGPDDAVVTRAE